MTGTLKIVFALRHSNLVVITILVQGSPLYMLVNVAAVFFSQWLCSDNSVLYQGNRVLYIVWSCSKLSIGVLSSFLNAHLLHGAAYNDVMIASYHEYSNIMG